MYRPSGLKAAPTRLMPPNRVAKIGDVAAPGTAIGEERSAWYM